MTRSRMGNLAAIVVFTTIAPSLPGQEKLGVLPTPVPEGSESRRKAHEPFDEQRLRDELRKLTEARKGLADERRSVQALIESQKTQPNDELSQLRRRFQRLLVDIKAQKLRQKWRSQIDVPPVLPKPSEPKKEPPKPKEPPTPPPTVVSPIELAEALFRAGKYDEAHRAFENIDLKGLDPSERLSIRFLEACSLQHLGKLDEAKGVFQEIAASQADPFLAQCAQWRLELLSWRQSVHQELQQLHRQFDQQVPKK